MKLMENFQGQRPRELHEAPVADTVGGGGGRLAHWAGLAPDWNPGGGRGWSTSASITTLTLPSTPHFFIPWVPSPLSKLLLPFPVRSSLSSLSFLPRSK